MVMLGEFGARQPSTTALVEPAFANNWVEEEWHHAAESSSLSLDGQTISLAAAAADVLENVEKEEPRPSYSRRGCAELVSYNFEHR